MRRQAENAKVASCESRGASFVQSRVASCELRGASCFQRRASAFTRASRPAPRASSLPRNSQPITRNLFPRGLTLIELLVTIVIMVTVLAGVIPMLSPNNDARKIREGARALSSMFAQAQAQAVRDGRPAGVAFREFGAAPGPYSGMAIEAYFIAEPQPFSGFSEYSRALVALSDTLAYGDTASTGRTPNGGTQFLSNYNGYPICQVAFGLYGAPDPFPPRMLKAGDKIEVAGNVFLICDDEDPNTMPNQMQNVNNVTYLLSDPTASVTPRPGEVLDCVWLNGDFDEFSKQYRRPLPAANAGVPFIIRRQPINTSDQPLQFPRAIGIDMHSSGAAGHNLPRDNFDGGGPDTVGIMFSPNGSLEALYFDGQRWDGVNQVFFLLGRVENGNNGTLQTSDYDFKNYPPADDAELDARRRRLNWLSPDSMWVALAARSGRVAMSENVTIDPTLPRYTDDLSGDEDQQAREQRDRHLAEVRKFAETMRGTGGR